MSSKSKAKGFLDEHMTKDEKKLLNIINKKLAKASLHLRLMTIKIHPDNSISTEFIPPIDKWIREDQQATAIIQEELTKYLAR